MKKIKFKVSYSIYVEREVDDKVAEQIIAGDEEAFEEIEEEALVEADDCISTSTVKADVEYGV